jgi:hypothetical protein
VTAAKVLCSATGTDNVLWMLKSQVDSPVLVTLASQATGAPSSAPLTILLPSALALASALRAI